MDGLLLLFAVLSVLFLGLVFTMNYLNVTTEPFASASASAGQATAAATEPSVLEPKIRAVLDPMMASGTDLCALYAMLRETGIKNAKAGPSGSQLSDAEAARQVEADFALHIEGGALPCPLLTYPRTGATDLDWLAFVQGIPKDFGARIVFMALYARDTLKEQLSKLKTSLGEGFQSICTPGLAESKRSAATANSCTLPEDLTPAQMEEAATEILKSLVAKKTSTLTAKKIDPTLDIGPIIKEASGYAAQLKKYTQQAQDGTLKTDLVVGSS